jgi:uncharacterized protein DUF6165
MTKKGVKTPVGHSDTQVDNVGSNPLVPVSWGELIDKITILEIKEKRLSSPSAIANVRIELELMRAAADAVLKTKTVNELRNELRAVNEALWEIEDEIRAKEASKSFDERFIELARAVYFRNDERGALKRRINEATNSRIIEEKQYTNYGGCRDEVDKSGLATSKTGQPSPVRHRFM